MSLPVGAVNTAFIRESGYSTDELCGISAMLLFMGEASQTMRAPVIAESIEDGERLDKRRVLGCARGQGYLFSKPVPPRHCKRFMQGTRLDLPDARQVTKRAGGFQPFMRRDIALTAKGRSIPRGY